MSPLQITEPVIQIIGIKHAILKEPYDCGNLIIPEGFHFDGASIPRFCWTIIGVEPFGRIVGAAILHDLCYCNLGNVRLKDGTWVTISEREADETFYERAKQCELNWLQSRLVRRAVIWFGDYDVKGKSKVTKWNQDWLKRYNNNSI